MAYAAAVKDASTVGLGGKYGGKLGNRYFGPFCKFNNATHAHQR